MNEMQSSRGVMPRNNPDASMWERATGFQRGPRPSPNNTPLQAMYRAAERKYEVAKVSDKEEAKQRQLKGILNNLTPQNFERLFEQVKGVNIDGIGTLMIVVSQIFDKALMEPTFCEMYANFCFRLAGALPDFIDENDELITFRRLLLNKCQMEFERGEREQAEAEKVEKGEINQSEQEREEKRLRSRRRMLGNIRLIGELFKKKMLTEWIMHECIKKLLGQYPSPDEEDIEALCELMATIGEMIDHSKAKVHMDAYFDMMHKLSTNGKVSSRVRFMLRDSIDLRKNKWQQRRKVEGLKKIDDVPRNTADASRWERATGFQRGLIPSPNNTPLQAMHKAERKYEVGKVADKEEAKQRQLKGIFNKLTPQNFARLFEQVREVNIDSLVTLTGLISQIFDRVLMEPIFCEMYVNFCFHLAGALPDFIDRDNKLITFRRLLLNKCQEEFERGGREKADAEKVEEEGEIKQSVQEREKKRLRARRRTLGNIRLIGELFKKKMLTERIMHECIKKLLGPYPSPDEEDIEALCILMSIIGGMIDSSKVKVDMDAYFDMMHKLSTNDKISSRVRFMLRDSIDLRKNKWQQRRKVEGPKKIEDIHRDAAQERLAVVSGGGGNCSYMTRGGSKGGQPSFDCKVLEDMTQKSQLRVVCNLCGAKVSGGEGDSPGIRREPAPSYRCYSDTNEGEEKQADRNNGETGNFTRNRPMLDISSSSSSGDDEMEEWLVGKKNTGLLASASSVKERRDKDDECVIMDSNLFQTPNVDFEHKLSLSDDNLSRFQDEEVAIISERDHVACRDYPHSRHHCVRFPFNKTTHERCCPQCYCYVCDRVAPCKYWKGSLGHCHASDEDPKWKCMRMFHRGSLAEGQQFGS